MALTDKKYEKFYKTTGTGDDKVEAKNLLIAEELWDADRAIGMRDHIVNPELAPLVFQLQQIQDELDYLRTEISTNKDKTGITTSQATAITDNSNNKMTVVPNSAFAGIQDLRCGVVYNARAGTHTLNFVYSETTPKATTTKTGSITLK